ncbi:hypothetical protein GCM10023187_56310 [Nibrella viscosa]|uniref:Uncharacterized protein n=1 Tax=Nibrella viscosa TaxID=1084524 RepID=A0ABP8L262_9BACT
MPVPVADTDTTVADVPVPEVIVVDVAVLDPAGVRAAVYVVVVTAGMASSLFFLQATNTTAISKTGTINEKRAFILFT